MPTMMPPHRPHSSSPAHSLLSQEVPNLNNATRGRHVDGEVSVNEAHLVQVALGNPRDHVVDVRANGADGGELGVQSATDDTRTETKTWGESASGYSTEEKASQAPLKPRWTTLNPTAVTHS